MAIELPVTVPRTLRPDETFEVKYTIDLPSPQNATDATALVRLQGPPRPSWACIKPEVRLTATCDQGGAGGSNQAPNEKREGWTQKPDVVAGHCHHDKPSDSSAWSHRWCTPGGSSLSIGIKNEVRAHGGYTKNNDCRHAQHCNASASYEVVGGGARLSVPDESRDAYELVVEAHSCPHSEGVTEPTAIRLNSEARPFAVGERIGLPQSLELAFAGKDSVGSNTQTQPATRYSQCSLELDIRRRMRTTNAMPAASAHAPSPSTASATAAAGAPAITTAR